MAVWANAADAIKAAIMTNRRLKLIRRVYRNSAGVTAHTERGTDLLLTPGEHVLRRDVAGCAVQADVVVMLDVALH